MTGGTPRSGGTRCDDEREHRVPEEERGNGVPVARALARSVGRRLLRCLGTGAAAVIASSATARAHEVGHVVGEGHGAASFLVVLGLPVVAGLISGLVAIRYRSRSPAGLRDRRSGGAVGLLLVGLGMASLLSAVAGQLWLSVAGGIVGAATALSFEHGETAPGSSGGTHAELTLGAVSTHRLYEGVLVGTLYTAGAAVGLVGAIVLAGHTALETAAVGGLYVTAQRRILVVGTVVLVQAGYVVGAVAGSGVAGAVPLPARTFVIAVVGGVFLVVGAGETGRSITAGRPARAG